MATSRLLALPAELRNTIYELCVVTEETTAVEPRNTNPPSETFLLTCRQVNEEARGIYKSAYRYYWTTTHFFLERDCTIHEGESSKWHLPNISSESLDHVQHLTITQYCEHENSKRASIQATLLAQSNLWRLVATFSNQTSSLSSMPRYYALDLDDKGRKYCRWTQSAEKTENEGAVAKFTVKEQISFALEKMDDAALTLRGRR